MLHNLGSPKLAFDFIVTDEKTTKFITTESGLYNIISLLKVGGVAVLTHLDEEYTWQYDRDAMTPKMSDRGWDLYNLNQRLIKSGHEIPQEGLEAEECRFQNTINPDYSLYDGHSPANRAPLLFP